MINRKLSILMVIFGGLGGAAGHFLGSAALTLPLPRPILAALYMMAIGLCVLLFCVLAETIYPIINGANWRRDYAGMTWRFLFPAAVLPLLAAGTLLQFAYQFEIVQRQRERDVYMLIDRSKSMEWNDPDDIRLDAVRRLTDHFEERDRIEIIAFDSSADVIHTLSFVSDPRERNLMEAGISKIKPGGGTDFNTVLTLVHERITASHAADTQAKNRETVVILLSDGESELNTDVLEPFISQNIPINGVGLLLDLKDGEAILSYIADQTNGKFLLAEETSQLDTAFAQIYQSNNRFILQPKTETGIDPLQWLLYIIAGISIAFATAFIFDNRYLTRPFIIGGGLGGLLAGAWLCMPVGLFGAAILLGCVFPLFALFTKTPPPATYQNNQNSFTGAGDAGFLRTKPQGRKVHGRF